MMFCPEDQAKCISLFITTRSVTQAQRNFRNAFNRESPSQLTIRYWHKKSMDTGSVSHKKFTLDDPEEVKKKLKVFVKHSSEAEINL